MIVALPGLFSYLFCNLDSVVKCHVVSLNVFTLFTMLVQITIRAFDAQRGKSAYEKGPMSYENSEAPD